jgi:hypothetical protein
MMAIILWLLLGILLGTGGTHAHHHVRRNYDGWSAARALGATRVKSRVSRANRDSFDGQRTAPQAGRNDFQDVRLLRKRVVQVQHPHDANRGTASASRSTPGTAARESAQLEVMPITNDYPRRAPVSRQ